MNKYILALCCMNSFCLGINLPWSSGGSIEADMTIKNPEKFAQGKLVPQYLDKATTYLSNIIKDTSLNEENIKARKRDAKKDRDLYNTLNSMDRNLQNVNDRLNALSRCLKYSTGQDYYVAIKNKYFKNINGIKDKASDPFNILKSDATNIEQNRDCLYRFLSWNVPGNKSVADLRKMSAREIMAEISNVKQLAINKGLDPNVSYVKLMREIGAFFNDELSKLEYDAFVDGPAALGRLVITDKKTREALKFGHTSF